MKKTTSSPLRHALLGTPQALVFKVLGIPTYVVLVRGKDVEHAVYEGTAHNLTWTEGVRLKFHPDGTNLVIDVYKDRSHNPVLDLLVDPKDYSHVHGWPLYDPSERMQLLDPRSYTLTLNGDKAVLVLK